MVQLVFVPSEALTEDNLAATVLSKVRTEQACTRHKLNTMWHRIIAYSTIASENSSCRILRAAK